MWFFVKDVFLNDDNDQNVKPGRDRKISVHSAGEEKKDAESVAVSQAVEIEDDDVTKPDSRETSRPIREL